jgi:hypothetical protein
MNDFTCEKCNGTFKKSWSHLPNSQQSEDLKVIE